jgi:hypothetical protein
MSHDIGIAGSARRHNSCRNSCHNPCFIALYDSVSLSLFPSNHVQHKKAIPRRSIRMIERRTAENRSCSVGLTLSPPSLEVLLVNELESYAFERFHERPRKRPRLTCGGSMMDFHDYQESATDCGNARDLADTPFRIFDVIEVIYTCDHIE